MDMVGFGGDEGEVMLFKVGLVVGLKLELEVGDEMALMVVAEDDGGELTIFEDGLNVVDVSAGEVEGVDFCMYEVVPWLPMLAGASGLLRTVVIGFVLTVPEAGWFEV